MPMTMNFSRHLAGQPLSQRQWHIAKPKPKPHYTNAVLLRFVAPNRLQRSPVSSQLQHPKLKKGGWPPPPPREIAPHSITRIAVPRTQNQLPETLQVHRCFQQTCHELGPEIDPQNRRETTDGFDKHRPPLRDPMALA